MKKVKSGNVTINYAIAGGGDKTLLFVHGSFMDHGWWNEQVNFFIRDYTVVTMDLGGHGKSGLNRSVWTVRKFGQDVVAVMKQLELKNIILTGHSIGADAMLEAAIVYPEPIIGIVGVDNFKNAGSPMPAAMKKQTDALLQRLETDFANASEEYARIALVTRETSEEITQKVVHAYRQADPLMGLKSTESVLGYYKRERKLLQQLRHRLYLINVDYIPTNEKALQQYAAGGYELIEICGTCHFPMIENPEEFNIQLKSIVSGL